MILVFVFLLRATLAAIVIAAGAAKLTAIQGFTTTLIGLGIPVHHKTPALIVPFLELIVGFAVISGLWSTITNIALFILMCCFSITTCIALLRKTQVACRCFGSLSDSQFNRKGLARSFLLVVAAALLIWSGQVYAFQIKAPLLMTFLLIMGYGAFAVLAAQAATTIAQLKEGMIT